MMLDEHIVNDFGQAQYLHDDFNWHILDHFHRLIDNN